MIQKKEMSRRTFLLAALGAGAGLLAACAHDKPVPTAGSTDTPEPTAEPTTAPTKKPEATATKVPPTPTEIPRTEIPPVPTEGAPIEVGRVKMTAEEYALIHTQNVTKIEYGKVQGKNSWTVTEMISPEVFEAREKTILAVRQRVIDELVDQTGVEAPENEFNSYLSWLNRLRTNGVLDQKTFWTYASNMIITAREIKGLVETRDPRVDGMEFPKVTDAGMDYVAGRNDPPFDEELMIVEVNQPDGSVVENMVPFGIQGSILAKVPSGLIPGEHSNGGREYAVIGDPITGKPFTIISFTSKYFGDQQYSGVENLRIGYYSSIPIRWFGWKFPAGNSGGVTRYHKTLTPEAMRLEQYELNTPVMTPPPFSHDKQTLVRIFWLHFLAASGRRYESWTIDENGVMVPFSDSVAYTQV